MARLVIAWQDARQYVHAIRLVVKRRLRGEDQQVGTVLPPADVRLQGKGGGAI